MNNSELIKEINLLMEYGCMPCPFASDWFQCGMNVELNKDRRKVPEKCPLREGAVSVRFFKQGDKL